MPQVKAWRQCLLVLLHHICTILVGVSIVLKPMLVPFIGQYQFNYTDTHDHTLNLYTNIVFVHLNYYKTSREIGRKYLSFKWVSLRNRHIRKISNFWDVRQYKLELSDMQKLITKLSHFRKCTWWLHVRRCGWGHSLWKSERQPSFIHCCLSFAV